MNNNSLDAYKSEKDNGNITKRQQQVIDFLKLVKGATGRQISKAVPGGWKRMKALCDMGLVRVCGNVKDPDTKKMVSVYELTGQQMLLPTPSVKRPTRKELESEISDLKYKNDKLYDSNCRMTKQMEVIYNNGYHDGVKQCDLVINSLKKEIKGLKNNVLETDAAYFAGYDNGYADCKKELKEPWYKIW